MEKNNFLNDLKKAVDEGKFNSDAAKKITEISDLAEKKSKGKTEDELKEAVDKKVEDSGIKTVDKDQVAELNSEYEKTMQERAKEEQIFATIATLENLDFNIDKVITELESFIIHQKKKYDQNDEKCEKLFEKINELEVKYKLKKED